MIQSRYYQEEAALAPMKYWANNNGEGNPLILLPTGTGKSIVIAMIIRMVLMQWPAVRILVLSHVKELIDQDSLKFALVCPHIPFGINSDGLGRRDTAQSVIFGTIKSVFAMIRTVGSFDIVIVDEAHKVTEDEEAQYRQLFRGLQMVNPNVVCVGLTATGFDNYGSIVRTDEKTGKCESFFTGVCYDRTKPEDFAEFVVQGWLSPLVAKKMNTVYDVSGVGMVSGEYNQGDLQRATDVEELTRQACMELIAIARMDNRHCWLVFGNGISHAEHIAEELQAQGVSATYVHSKMKSNMRDDRIEAYKAGEYEAMVNNGIMTTGFDHPPIDLIGVIRHTTRIALWDQILGRGTRPYDWTNPNQYIPGFEYIKSNCLVCDFAENTSRLGPIDMPFFKKRKKGEPGDAPVKICPVKQCEVYNYASARFCANCNHEFQFEVKFDAATDDASPMSNGEVPTALKTVSFVNYAKLTPKSSPPMLKVSYHCGFNDVYDEVVCLEHTTRAKSYAWGWWKQRTQLPVPSFVDDALKVTSQLKRPMQILVELGGKHKKVLEYVY